MQAVGAWMDVNGEAIYATKASPFPRRLPWGRVTLKVGADGSPTLYLHVWSWPTDGKLLLPTLMETPVSARLLKGGITVQTETSPSGLVVNLPSTAPDPDVSVVALKFSGPITITQETYISPNADGLIVLSANDADTHGGMTGNIVVSGSGPDAFLSQSRYPKWFVEYRIKTPVARTWLVSAEVIAPKPAAIIIKRGGTEVLANIPATGETKNWTTVQLGSIKLPAAEITLRLAPVKKGWNAISVRNVTLTPSSKAK